MVDIGQKVLEVNISIYRKYFNSSRFQQVEKNLSTGRYQKIQIMKCISRYRQVEVDNEYDVI